MNQICYYSLYWGDSVVLESIRKDESQKKDGDAVSDPTTLAITGP